MRKHPLLLVILCAKLITFGQQPTPSPTPPQQQTASDDIVRITTNLVQVDAVVTRDGKPVTDLKPEEVEIYEDGRQQKITNFGYFVAQPSSPETPTGKRTPIDKNAPPVPPTRLRPEDVRRTIALVVDDLNMPYENVYFVQRALKKFVDEQMQPGDLVAIIRTSGGLGALQQFTADKRQLHAAIERVKWFVGGDTIGTFGPAASSLVSDPSYIPGEDVERFREDVFAVGSLGAISYVLRGLRELPGRKELLFLSGGITLFRQDDLARSSRVRNAITTLTDQANRASVVINTMDIRGLPTLNFEAADSNSAMRPDQSANKFLERRAAFWSSQDGLKVLAEQTGGISILNNNDIAGGIRKVMTDLNGYYLIGYRPDASTFDREGRRRFHHLSLKVKRPGSFTVRMRKGFARPTDDDESAPRTSSEQLIGALVSPFGATGVHLQLTSLFANDAPHGSFMRSILYIDPGDLIFTKDSTGLHSAEFAILAITFGYSGAPIDEISKIITIKLNDKQYERMRRQGLVYYITVPIKKAGAYQLRIALRDAGSEQVGSASQFIEAPDIKKDRLALSGLVLRGGTASIVPGTEPPPGNEGVDEGDAEASPVVRHFRPGMIVDYGYYIYNARLDKTNRQPQLQTQIRLFRDGKEIFTGKEIPLDCTAASDLKRVAAGGSLQLGTEMAPGDYVLQVVVTDLMVNGKNRVTTQWMDFELIK